MKQVIYKYNVNNEDYYISAYSESRARFAIKKHFNLKDVSSGERLKDSKILRKIWERKNTKFNLLFKAEDITPNDLLKFYKGQQHSLYELELLLKEDEKFFNGMDELFIKDSKNNVVLWNRHLVNTNYVNGYSPYNNINNYAGYMMPYSVNGLRDEKSLSKCYRFKNVKSIVNHVKNNLIKYKISNYKYKKTGLTLMEMLESYEISLQ